MNSKEYHKVIINNIEKKDYEEIREVLDQVIKELNILNKHLKERIKEESVKIFFYIATEEIKET